jgi:hypothetical protein
MILGRDVLTGLGIKFDFANNSMEWDSVVIPMKETDADISEAFNVQEPATVISATDRFKGILEAKYEKADLSEVVKEAAHLTEAQQRQLHDLLKGFPSLFDGTLGKWNMGAYNIELQPVKWRWITSLQSMVVEVGSLSSRRSFVGELCCAPPHSKVALLRLTPTRNQRTDTN